MKERRVSIESFDVNSYCKSYKDLRSAFINDSSRYYMHYLQYGYNEGRKPVGEKEFQGTVTSMRGQDYSDVYDYEYYINRYPDIKKYVSNKMAPDASALEHFINCGMKENRQASEDFDVIWEQEIPVQIDCNTNIKATEKLFIYNKLNITESTYDF